MKQPENRPGLSDSRPTNRVGRLVGWSAAAVFMAAFTAAAQAPAVTDWHRCVAGGASMLEDGRSEARSIAAAVVMNCRTARIEALVKEARARGISNANEYEILSSMADAAREQDIDYVSALVLSRRAKR